MKELENLKRYLENEGINTDRIINISWKNLKIAIKKTVLVGGNNSKKIIEIVPGIKIEDDNLHLGKTLPDILPLLNISEIGFEFSNNNETFVTFYFRPGTSSFNSIRQKQPYYILDIFNLLKSKIPNNFIQKTHINVVKSSITFN